MKKTLKNLSLIILGVVILSSCGGRVKLRQNNISVSLKEDLVYDNDNSKNYVDFVNFKEGDDKSFLQFSLYRNQNETTADQLKDAYEDLGYAVTEKFTLPNRSFGIVYLDGDDDNETHITANYKKKNGSWIEITTSELHEKSFSAKEIERAKEVIGSLKAPVKVTSKNKRKTKKRR